VDKKGFVDGHYLALSFNLQNIEFNLF